MILDAGLLIAVDRGERAAQSFLPATWEEGAVLHTTAPVVAQVWRDGSRQTRLAKFLGTVEVHDFTLTDALVVGDLLSRSQTSDVVDAHLVALALRLPDNILTADAPDFSALHVPPRPPSPPRASLAIESGLQLAGYPSSSRSPGAGICELSGGTCPAKVSPTELHFARNPGPGTVACPLLAQSRRNCHSQVPLSARSAVLPSMTAV